MSVVLPGTAALRTDAYRLLPAAYPPVDFFGSRGLVYDSWDGRRIDKYFTGETGDWMGWSVET